MQLLTVFCLVLLQQLTEAKNQISSEPDSVYLFLTMTVHEKDFSKGTTHSEAYFNEKATLREAVRKELKKVANVKWLTDSTCMKGIELDSIHLKDPMILEKLCRSCNLKKAVLLDIDWTYLSEASYWAVRPNSRGTVTTGNSMVRATWWKLHASFYVVGEGVKYDSATRFTQLSNVRPMKKFPGFTHLRFIRKSIRPLKAILEQN